MKNITSTLRPLSFALGLLLLLSPPVMRGADVNLCRVRKKQAFIQTSTNAPVRRNSTPFGFAANAYVDSSNALSTASLGLPDSSTVGLTWAGTNLYSRPGYAFSADFASEESLDAAYPSGQYTWFLQTTHDGEKIITNNLLPAAYPNAPWIRNFAEAQAVDAQSDFRLEWAPFAGATTDDVINFELWVRASPWTNLVFEAPAWPPFCGTNTSVVIPANTLAAGQNYQAFLVFTKVPEYNTNTYPGVVCSASRNSYTIFTLRTIQPHQFYYVTNDNDTLAVTGYTGPGGAVTIPGGTGGYPVTAIGPYAFYGCASLTSVTVPNRVTNIDNWSFQDCTNLTAVYFRGDAPSVGLDVFAGADKTAVYYLPGTIGWGPTFGGRPTAPWLLPYPVILTFGPGFGVKPNGFGFIISWAANQPVVVSACTNLANPAWLPLRTVTLTDGRAQFIDSQWGDHPARVYRLSVP